MHPSKIELKPCHWIAKTQNNLISPVNFKFLHVAIKELIKSLNIFPIVQYLQN